MKNEIKISIECGNIRISPGFLKNLSKIDNRRVFVSHIKKYAKRHGYSLLPLYYSILRKSLKETWVHEYNEKTFDILFLNSVEWAYPRRLSAINPKIEVGLLVEENCVLVDLMQDTILTFKGNKDKLRRYLFYFIESKDNILLSQC